MSYNLPEELGFFELFVSTQWVDIAHIQQGSPFKGAKGGNVEDLDVDLGDWDTVVVSSLLLK
jgi:hypothetical protein